jgi:NADH dehydrogenase
MKHILILGAGYAGLLAAIRLSHTARKHDDVQVTLVNAADTFVERIRLHEVAANNPPHANRIQDMLRGTGIRFVQGWVTAVHPDTKTVEVQQRDGAETFAYDKLVYALGSSVDRDSVQGVRDYAYTLDSHSAPLLAQRMKAIASKSGHVVVIGSGFTGIEAATEFADTYPDVQVTMLTRGTLGENLSQAGQQYLQKTFAEMGITVRENVNVREITADGIQLANGDTIKSDATIWSAGFKLSPIAREAGFAVNSAGQIIVDAALRSISHPDVYAAGDALTFEAGAPLAMRMSCQIAMPLGGHVADNLAAWLAGEPERVFRFGYSAQCIGLGRKRTLLQLINPDDSMKQTIITGRLGRWIKVGILNFTLWAIKLERMVPAYRWIQPISLSQSQPVEQLVREY